MGRANKTGRSANGPPFVQLFHYMLKGDAWLSLTPQDRAVYVALAAKFNGNNNGYLALSVRVAADQCNINKDTAAACLRRLQERGFIERTQEGKRTAGAFAAEWRLCTHRCDRTGKAPSRAFQKYQLSADERVRKEGRSDARTKRQATRAEEKARSEMRGQGVPYEGPEADYGTRNVRNEGTETAPSAPNCVRSQGTHIHLAIGSEPEDPPCCVSDDAREARPPQGRRSERAATRGPSDTLSRSAKVTGGPFDAGGARFEDGHCLDTGASVQRKR